MAAEKSIDSVFCIQREVFLIMEEGHLDNGASLSSINRINQMPVVFPYAEAGNTTFSCIVVRRDIPIFKKHFQIFFLIQAVGKRTSQKAIQSIKECIAAGMNYQGLCFEHIVGIFTAESNGIIEDANLQFGVVSAELKKMVLTAWQE